MRKMRFRDSKQLAHLHTVRKYQTGFKLGLPQLHGPADTKSATLSI